MFKNIYLVDKQPRGGTHAEHGVEALQAWRVDQGVGVETAWIQNADIHPVRNMTDDTDLSLCAVLTSQEVTAVTMSV